MPEPVEVQYRDLLNPIKDPEKSFGINISELLQSYITSFVQGRVPPNFNSAALLLQGSSSIYGKKVEYLHNLATQLYQSLVKNKKDELIKKDTKEKERNHREKENKLNDPFFSIEIKPGKNLSCLRRKKNVSNKKTGKKADAKKYTFVPVDLLPLEGEEKGDIFYDTRGDVIGNRGDYALNKCRVTESGWLLLPTVSPEAVPALDSPPDYSLETDLFADDSYCNGDEDMPDPSPADEGYPASSGSPSVPSSQETPMSSQEPFSQTPSQPITEDEGLGSLPSTPVEGGTDVVSASEQPMEGVSDLEGVENIPVEGQGSDLDLALRPVRRSMRQALKLCQLEQEGAQNQQEENIVAKQNKEEEILVVKKAIQKKNTCNLPSKLRAVADENSFIQPASGYCARTFFSMDNHILKGTLLRCGVSAFGINSKLCKRIADHYEFMNKKNRTRKKSDDGADPAEDDLIDVLGSEMEIMQSIEGDNMLMPSPLEDGDIVIDNDPIISLPDEPDVVAGNAQAPDEMMSLPSTSEEVPALDEDMLIESFNAHSHHVISNALKGVDKNADISRKVYQWEQSIKPFLDQLDKREAFDINMYGSRILNSFEDSNRKQSTTFRNFCKGKEKWEIHRYFMALLPLVNIGNVSIETANNKDGEEDIFVTLLSRKMHHKELEEFGHNDGGHS